MKIISQPDSAPIITPEDLQILRNYFVTNAPLWHRAIFEVAINTGLKNSELTTLRYQDFLASNLGNNNILALDSYSHIFTPIAINNSLYVLIKKLFIETVDEFPETTLDNFIFVGRSPRNAHMDNIPMHTRSMSRIFRQARENTGVNPKYTFSSLRSTFLYEYWGVKTLPEEVIINKYNTFYL